VYRVAQSTIADAARTRARSVLQLVDERQKSPARKSMGVTTSKARSERVSRRSSPAGVWSGHWLADDALTPDDERDTWGALPVFGS
jgi:hypothetical protein